MYSVVLSRGDGVRTKRARTKVELQIKKQINQGFAATNVLEVLRLRSALSNYQQQDSCTYRYIRTHVTYNGLPVQMNVL